MEGKSSSQRKRFLRSLANCLGRMYLDDLEFEHFLSPKYCEFGVECD